MMNSNTDSPADSGERGFTLTEALAAIGIISILTALVLSFLSSSIASSARSKDTLFFFKDMLLADEKIRELAGEVVIPYWERLPATQTGSGSSVSELIPGNGTRRWKFPGTAAEKKMYCGYKSIPRDGFP